MVMTVKYLNDEEKPESRSLWEEAFPEDSVSFVNYYFQEKLRDNRILAIVETPPGRTMRMPDPEEELRPGLPPETWRVEAMIHQNPYRLQVGLQRWKVDYLVGISTRREKRHRGYMTMLLTKFLKDAKAEQAPFCFLMPADEEIYRPFGFTYIFRQPRWEWKPEVLKNLKRRPLLPWTMTEGNYARLSETAQWMNNWMKKRYQVFALRNTEYLYRLLQEIASEDGILDVYYDGDAIAGIYGEWGRERREQRLLYGEEAYVQMAGSPRQAIMARLITPEVFLKAVHLREDYGEQEIDIRLHIEDPLIEENTATWIWHMGRKGSRMEKVYVDMTVRQSEREAPDLELTITELTEWLFGGDTPEQVQGYAELIEPLNRVFLDEIV